MEEGYMRQRYLKKDTYIIYRLQKKKYIMRIFEVPEKLISIDDPPSKI